MYYYTFLSVAVIVAIVLARLLWHRTNSIAFPFGIAVLYFWSLHGAWAIVTDQLGGDSQKHYHYLFEKMFPVYLDEYYTWTLALYAVFILCVGITALLSVHPVRLPIENPRLLILSHDRILLVGGMAAFLSYRIMQKSLGSAIDSGVSAYVVTRATTDIGWFHIHQVLNRIALIPTAIGFAVLMAGGSCRCLGGDRSFRHYFGYAAVLGFTFCFCVVLGNKNELAFALFTGSLFYLFNSTRPAKWRFAALGIALLACVGFIDYARGLAVDDLASNVSFGEVAFSLVRLANSNEAFAAHMSLYGAMSHDLPLTYGSSIYSFIASAIPRMFWPDRPDDIYWYYANGVGAVQGQGYSIHHAAGWYLNFGIFGIVLGGVLMGRIWAAMYNAAVRFAHRRGPTWRRIFCIVGFFTFTANLPTLIRVGPEGYKSVLVDCLFIPVAVLTLAHTGERNRQQSRLAVPSYSLNRIRQSLPASAAPLRPKSPPIR